MYEILFRADGNLRINLSTQNYRVFRFAIRKTGNPSETSGTRRVPRSKYSIFRLVYLSLRNFSTQYFKGATKSYFMHCL